MPFFKVAICDHNRIGLSKILSTMPVSTSKSTRELLTSDCTIANLLRAIQALRRSIKGDKDKNPQIGIGPKSAVAIVPPKKVSSIA